MSIVSQIAKETLAKVTKDGKNLTPDNYSEIFCKIAKSKGLLIEDCQKIDKYIAKLDDDIQKEIKGFNIRNLDELFMFISTRLNRTKPNETAKQISLFVVLLKRVMQVASMLHNKEVSELSRTSIERLSKFQDIQTLELLKEKWFSVLANYDDGFLDKISKFMYIDKTDLKKTILSFVDLKNDTKSTDESIMLDDDLGKVIASSLVPSIASSVNDKIAIFSNQLKEDVNLLNSPNGQKDFQKAIKTRIELDKQEVTSKISSIDKILSEISKRIVTIIDKSTESSDEVNAIKREIEKMDFSKDNFETIQRKLIKLASSLEIETNNFTKKLEDSNKKVDELKSKVSILEYELKVAKKEAKEDGLTSVANRKALDDELDKFEHSFNRNGINYSVVFVDIDYFKKINDNYGHDAGDTVLRALGRVLKKYTRDIDTVGRYGGEEFLVVLQKNSLQEAVAFAEKLRKVVSNFKFLYKGERISVTFSAGVASRDDSQSKDETIIAADKRLYEAKNSGRNRVCPSV